MMKPNRPTPLGREAGAQLARLTEVELAKLREKGDFPDDRCGSCAFRAGTIPNGCEQTVLAAFECVVTGEPFMCHVRRDENDDPLDVCAGWAMTWGRTVERAAT